MPGLLERVAGRVFGEPVLVDQRLALEVRRGQGKPFEDDPAVFAVRIECFPLRQLLDWEFEEIGDGAAASAAGPSDTPPHVRGSHSALVRLLIRPSTVTAQSPVEIFGLPDVDAVFVIKRHLYQIYTRSFRSGWEARRKARPNDRAKFSPD